MVHSTVKFTTWPTEERREVLLMCFKITEQMVIESRVGTESRPNVSTWFSAERYRQGAENSGKTKGG